MKDMTCLGEGLVFEADMRTTGINLNEMVVGATGCGKSFSTAYPRLLHTYGSSVVVPIAKKALKRKFEKMFRDRGYEVITIDFANPDNSTYGYDPLDYVHSDEDIINLAKNVVDNDPEGIMAHCDPYWTESAASALAAEIQLICMNAREKHEKPCFADVIELHRCISLDPAEAGAIRTSLDPIMEAAARKYPGNQAVELWKTMQRAPFKTGSCIFSTLNTALDKIHTGPILRMMRKEKMVNFGSLGERKTALFILTSPMNSSMQNLLNILYADMFRCLFEKAESHPSGELEVPVHIICDDFACSGKIRDFDNYISVFRAAGISVTMLIQSESQLTSMYGQAAATTIINNCDTYVYMGGMDMETCRNISQKSNKPLEKIIGMPLEQVIVFRRGSLPVITRRYQTLKDPLYAELDTETEMFSREEEET